MKSKLVGIMIGVMMLATILPITAMATTDSPANSSGSGPFDHTTIRGIVLFKRTSEGGKNIHFFAIRVHYSTVWLSGEHEKGVLRMSPIVVPSDMIGFYGHMYIFASFRGSLK
jgi:hypothetical protein